MHKPTPMPYTVVVQTARAIIAVLCCTVAVACGGDEETFDPPPAPVGAYLFEDGFESSSSLEALLPSDDSRWTAVQLVNPSDSRVNALALSRDTVHEGSAALRVTAKGSGAELSKAAIEKGGFAAYAGAGVRLAASFYVAGTADLTDLFLVDLECCACWDPDVADNQCPGVRLTVKEGDFLAIERGKILGTTITQSRVPIPREEWFDLSWEMTLAPGEDGANRLLLDGIEVVAVAGANMPDAETFRAAFAAEGIDFELREPVAYERFQIGATANPTAEDVTLYVDEVRLEIVD